MGYIRYYVVPAELEITPRRIAEEDKMQNWWLAGYIRSCCQLSFHHQLLDYCLQAKKMLCFIFFFGEHVSYVGSQSLRAPARRVTSGRFATDPTTCTHEWSRGTRCTVNEKIKKIYNKKSDSKFQTK
jgi:hypothetical protein